VVVAQCFGQNLEGSVQVAETDEDARSIDLQTAQSALGLQRARFPALQRRACGAELARAARTRACSKLCRSAVPQLSHSAAAVLVSPTSSASSARQ